MNMMTRMPHTNGPLFPRRLAILPDESLIGFVTRLSAEHGWRRMSDLLDAAGAPRVRPSSFGDLAPGEAAALSVALGLRQEDVARRAYGEASAIPAERPPRRPMAAFFGDVVPAAWLMRVNRRYAPSALRASPHHRAMWDVSPLPYCAETYEILRSRCPACARTLGWRQTCGIAFCEHCRDRGDEPGIDLRAVAPVPTREEDRDALRFVADLIHPDGARRMRARGAVPAGLQGHGGGDLLALVILIALAEPERKQPDRSPTDDDVERALGKARRIAEAARAVMAWPDGVVDLMRRRSSRRGAGPMGGVRKIDLLAPFVGLPPALAASAASLIDGVLAEASHLAPGQVARRVMVDPGLLSLQQASDALGLKSVHMRDVIRQGGLQVVGGDADGTVMVRARDVAALKEALAGSMRPENAAHLMGVGRSDLRRLVEAGHLDAATGAVALLRTEHAVTTRSLKDLRGALRRACGLPQDEPRMVPVDEAIRRLGPGEKRWDLLITAILDRRIDGAAPEKDALGIDAIRIRTDADLAFMLDPEPWTDEPWRDVTEAAHWLGTNRAVVRRLAEGGMLPRRGHWLRSFAVQDLAAFSSRFMLGSEAAAVTRIAPRYLHEVLCERGLRPAARPGDGKTTVWDRKAVNDAACGA